MKFNEHSLEMAIINLLTDEGYTHVNGKDLQRDKSEVFLIVGLIILHYMSKNFILLNQFGHCSY